MIACLCVISCVCVQAGQELLWPNEITAYLLVFPVLYENDLMLR